MDPVFGCNKYYYCKLGHWGGVVATWLVSPTPDRAVLAQALAEDLVLCSWQDS